MTETIPHVHSRIHLGDKVKVITPEFFVRCGYPWTRDYVVENILTTLQKEELKKLISGTCSRFPYDVTVDNAYHKMLREWAAGILIKNGYGGKERSVHTQTYEKYRGMVFEVEDKKIVKTGTYQSGGGNYEDYDPPYLSNSKSHVILGLGPYQQDILGTHCATDDYGQPLRIESVHVERVEDECE